MWENLLDRLKKTHSIVSCSIEGQKISEVNFLETPLPKKQTKFFEGL